MKKYLINLIPIILILSMISCGVKVNTTANKMDEELLQEYNLNKPATTGLSDSLQFSDFEETDGSNECIHNRCGNTYHYFRPYIIDYIGNEVFFEWVKNVEKLCVEQATPECSIPLSNIVQLIRDLNISREEMEMLARYTDLYYEDYNLDVIYSNDDKLIEQYYTTPSWEKEEFVAKVIASGFKVCLQEYVVFGEIGNLKSDPDFELWDSWIVEKYQKKHEMLLTNNKEKIYMGEAKIKGEFIDVYLGDFTGNSNSQWSIAELVRNFDIPKEKFINLYTWSRKYDEYKKFQYNIDLLYNDQRLDYMIEQGVDAAVIDSMYSTSDGIFRDDLIYEMTIKAIQQGEEITINDINIAVEADKSK